MKWIVFTFTFTLFSIGLFATDYYVGGSGASDSNPGTATQPFATIQKAASVARAGDVVTIRSGIYRETITPTNSGGSGSPITFQPDNGASVIVSGLNTADGGWTVHSGNIYKKAITLPVNGYSANITSNTTLLANQVFKDSKMMFEARWPKINSVDELFDISKQRFLAQSAFQPGNLVDAGLPNVPGGLVGATIITNGWFVTSSSTISSHSGSQISYANIWDNSAAGLKMRKSYFVTGKLGLLTQAKEWHYESGTLYFWQEGGGSPTGVEYKARNWGFDIRGKSYIKITGLSFIGCEPASGDDNTNYTLIDNIRATYTNHNVRHDTKIWQGYGMSKQMGIKLGGAGNVFKNSEVSYSASQGVWIGANGRVENNLMHHIGYDASMGAPVGLWGVRTNGAVVTKNTFHTVSRTCLDWGWDWWSDRPGEADSHGHQNVEISYNDMYNYCLLNVDGGATYAWGSMNLNGSSIHHNWIHDCGATNPNSKDGILVGLYFDQASGGVTIHHNVMWNNGVADHYHETAASYFPAGRINYLYNNTHGWNPTGGVVYHSYVTFVNNPNDVLRNNIYQRDLVFNWGNGASNNANSVNQGANPQFVGSGGSGLNYRIQGGSPARDAGTVIPGITDGSVGVPDIGAYEYGATDWVPGYKAVAFVQNNAAPVVGLTAPANNATFATGVPITISANASDADGSITKVEFYSGTTKIGEDLTSPYSFVWNNATAGTYAVTAKATDNLNSITTSAPVTVIVSAANAPPTVAITSPSANALLVTGSSVTITATATDNVSVTKVEFYSGTTKIGEDTSGPYSFTWTNAPAGTQVLTAKAYDNQNNVTTSTAVTVTISSGAAPITAITAPANGAKVNTGTPVVITATASDTNGTITKVEFYAGAVKLGEDPSNPYSFSWANAAVGAYTLTVKAYDNSGNVTTSAGVSITVDAAISGLPYVQITAPLNNAQVTAGTPINITATATDSDGTITKVEFYNGATLLGEDNSSPYSYAWSNATAGVHAITAKATDNQGGTSTSVVINITVNAPGSSASPTISAGDDVNIFLPENSVTLNGSGSSTTSGAVSFNWIQVSGPSDVNIADPNTQSVVVNNLVEGIYVFELKVTDANGTTSNDQVTVNVSSESALAGSNIPRYFTPNSDGVNDTWQWPETQLAETSQVTVFNRFGKKVYESSAYNNSWDGKSDGQVLQDDAYYYVIKRENATDIQGAVRIIR